MRKVVISIKTFNYEVLATYRLISGRSTKTRVFTFLQIVSARFFRRTELPIKAADGWLVLVITRQMPDASRERDGRTVCPMGLRRPKEARQPPRRRIRPDNMPAKPVGAFAFFSDCIRNTKILVPVNQRALPNQRRNFFKSISIVFIEPSPSVFLSTNVYYSPFTAMDNASIFSGGTSGRIASWLGEMISPVLKISFSSAALSAICRGVP